MLGGICPLELSRGSQATDMSETSSPAPRSQHVELREVQDPDLDIFFEQGREPEAVRMAAFTAQDPSDRSHFEIHWARIRADRHIIIRTILAGGAVAGSILSHAWFGDLEVSYWLGRSFWGRGIASQALRLFLEVQTVRPIFGRVAADNHGSLRVLEKCGFRVVGQDRGYANARGEMIDEWVLRLD